MDYWWRATWRAGKDQWRTAVCQPRVEINKYLRRRLIVLLLNRQLSGRTKPRHLSRAIDCVHPGPALVSLALLLYCEGLAQSRTCGAGIFTGSSDPGGRLACCGREGGGGGGLLLVFILIVASLLSKEILSSTFLLLFWNHLVHSGFQITASSSSSMAARSRARH